MKIQLKRSNVLESSAAKQPTAGQMEYGELAVNYNSNDPAIFIKDSNNQIIRIAGAGYDYNDLANLPTIGDGTITISANGETVGTFTVNQEGDTEIELPDSGKLNPPSPNEPGGTPENGDLWIDSSECPPVLKIWSDCDGTGKWYVLAAAGPQPISPQPGDGNNSTTPAVLGSGTEADPYILTAATVEYGEAAESVETINLIGQTPANLVQFNDINSGTNGNRFAQPVGVIAADGTWSGKVYFDDSPDSTSELTYSGLLKLGGLHYKWDVTMEEPARLEVGKGQLSPTSGETGETFTGSATVINAENPVEVHVFSLDGVEKQRGASNTYVPTAAGNLTYHKEVTDDNNQSAVVGEESDAAVITIPPGPTATMSGLRFDSNRNTMLTKTVPGQNPQTFSFWAKFAGDPSSSANNYVLQQKGGSNGQIDIWISDGVWKAQQNLKPGISASTDKWDHIVHSFDGTEWKFYINGVLAGTDSGKNPGTDLMVIGAANNGADNHFNGYLSDWYFVDGKAAPPTTFGKFFPGDKWGPLDSAVIQDNLDNIQPADPTPEPGPGEAGQPYDDRANTSKVWSNGVTSNANFFAGNPATAIFNGRDSGSGSAGETEGTGAATFIQVASLGFTGTTSLRIKGLWTQIEINGEAQNTGLINNAYYTFNNVENLDTIKIYGSDANPASGPVLYQIEVDGRVLVDQGVWNNSQNWSGDASGGRSSSNPANAFDGNLSTGYTIDGAEFFEVTFDTPLSGNFQIAGIIASSGSNPVLVAFNDGSENSYNLGGESFPASFTDLGNQTSVSKITVRATGSSWNLAAFKLDDAILVDSGAQWDTSQVWSNYLSTDDPAGFYIAPSQAFDGKYTPADTATGTRSTNVGKYALFTPPTPINVTSTVTVYGGAGGQGPDTNTIIINEGLGSETTFISTGAAWGGQGSTSFTGQLVSLKVLPNNGANTASYAHISAIIIDDKVLVDGTAVWNTSQRWADYLSASGGTSYIENPDNAFDGDVASLAQLKSSTNGDQLIFGATLTGVTKLDVLSRSVCDISGTGFSTISGAPAGWVTIHEGASTTISNITLTKTGNDPGIYAIRQNGEILVNSAYTWNSSQVWSEGAVVTNADSNPFSVLFDGSSSTAWGAAPGNDSKSGAILATTITANSKVRVLRKGSSANGGTGPFTLGLNDETYAIPANSTAQFAPQWFEVPIPSGDFPITFNQITTARDSTGQGSATYMLEVDGEILVDPGFGGNGFYLPFDPAQTGAIYSSGTATGTTPSASEGDWAQVFDGSSATAVVGSAAQRYRFKLDNAINNVTKVRAYFGGENSIKIFLNDDTNTGVQSNQGNGFGWVDITAALNGSTSITDIGIDSANSGSNGLLYALEVNDVVLVDHSSIGVDMSGNNNNFHDQNFGVGNTDHTWSELLSTGSSFGAPKSDAFNGSLTGNGTYSNNAGSYIEVDLTGKFSGSRTFVVYISNSANSFTVDYTGNSGSATLTDVVGSATIVANNLTTIRVTGTSSGAELYGITVDGVKLIDPSAVDQVLDTPMKNYAVLDGGSNGNLELLSGGFVNSTIDPSDKIYFEYTTGANLGGGLMQSLAGVSERSNSLGWGSNLDKWLLVGMTTRDNTIKIKGLNFPEQDITALNNGTDNVPGSIVSVAYDQANSKVYFAVNNKWINNDLTIAGSGTGDGFDVPSTWVPLADVDNLTQSSFINFGQQPFVYTPPVGYEGFYQTWEEYARSSLGYALDRIAQLEALRLADAATIADLRTQIAGALSRIASIESDEVNDDAVDSALITLVGSLNSQVTAWSTRITEAEAKIADYEGRITTLES